MAAPVPDEAMLARVAALRKLASQDVVPAIYDIVQSCCVGGEVEIARTVAGPGRFVGLTKPIRLCFEAPKDTKFRVTEAAVVLGATAVRQPAAFWRGARVVEIGSGAAYVGVLLAALGARVEVTDLPSAESVAAASIARNARAFHNAGSAAFSVLDWSRPLDAASSNLFASASIIVAADPVIDEASLRDFIALARAVLGVDVGRTRFPGLRYFLVAHKHQQSFCVSGYVAPSADARPAITHAEECERCLFLRSLLDAGLAARQWQAPPKDFAHPFVECWEIGPARPAA